MKIGIDLGTTYSVAAWVDGNNIPTAIVNGEGSRLTPSVVMEDHNGKIVVGEVAKERAVIMAPNVVSAVKDKMGTKYVYTMPSGQQYTPEVISSFILKKIRKDVERSLGQEVTGAVITVPAYFSDAQRKSTEDAARIAGLNVLNIINEPTAAAISYAHTNRITDAKMLVYDLGGGTFDATIVRVLPSGGVEVMATDGIRNTGGHFFDELIQKHVINYLLEKHDLDLYDDDYEDELCELAVKAEACKIRLSTMDEDVITIKIDRIKEALPITRLEFEEMIRRFIKRTMDIVDGVLDDAGMLWGDIQKILLVGGSCRIPLVAETLRSLSGIDPSYETSLDEAVAFGAALYANNAVNQLIDVSSHSLGLITVERTIGPDNKHKDVVRNTIILPRNSTLPAKVEWPFSTLSTTSKIMLQITEGEDEDADYVTQLADLTIQLPPNTPPKTPVTVEMLLNENQILHVFVRIATTPEVYREIEIDRKSNLSEDEIMMQMALVSEKKVQ